MFFSIIFFLGICMYLCIICSQFNFLLVEGEWLILKFETKYLWFMLMLILVSFLIMLYSKYYMMYTNLMFRFFSLFIFFMMSMLILIFSYDLLSLFWGWDLLGVSSYFLVVMFLNWRSQNSGMVTMLSNRFGDCLFIFFICWLIFFNIHSELKICSIITWSIFICFCLTKSAVFPFSVWLPLAMAAPTPISALVHSSTLVTAGVLMIMKMINYSILKFMLLIISFLTMLTLLSSGALSIKEMDFKKIIALSTLSQMSLILFLCSFYFKIISFFHLLSHSLFKSLLFISVGVLIHLNFNEQMSSLYMKLWSPLILFCFVLSGINLMGLFFSSGFYSKDLLLDSFTQEGVKMSLEFFFLILMSFTFMYSVRIIYSTLSGSWILNNFIISLFVLLSVFWLCFASILFYKIYLSILFKKEMIPLGGLGFKSFLVYLILNSCLLYLLLNMKVTLLMDSYFYLKFHTFFLNFFKKVFNKFIKEFFVSFWNEMIFLWNILKLKFYLGFSKTKIIKFNFLILLLGFMLLCFYC